MSMNLQLSVRIKRKSQRDEVVSHPLVQTPTHVTHDALKVPHRAFETYEAWLRKQFSCGKCGTTRKTFGGVIEPACTCKEEADQRLEEVRGFLLEHPDAEWSMI